MIGQFRRLTSIRRLPYCRELQLCCVGYWSHLVFLCCRIHLSLDQIAGLFIEKKTLANKHNNIWDIILDVNQWHTIILTHQDDEFSTCKFLKLTGHTNILTDSDSEFDDDLDYDPNLEDNEDFYQEVNNIYDAPSLRPGSMTSSNTVMTPPSSPPAPLEEGSTLNSVYRLLVMSSEQTDYLLYHNNCVYLCIPC